MRKHILIIEKWKQIQNDNLLKTNIDYPNRKKFIRVRERSGSKSTTTTTFTQRWLHMKQINCHN